VLPLNNYNIHTLLYYTNQTRNSLDFFSAPSGRVFASSAWGRSRVHSLIEAASYVIPKTLTKMVPVVPLF